MKSITFVHNFRFNVRYGKHLLSKLACNALEATHILIGFLYHPPKADNAKVLDYLISSLDTMLWGNIMLEDFRHDLQLRSYPMKQLVTDNTRKLTILAKNIHQHC